MRFPVIILSLFMMVGFATAVSPHCRQLHSHMLTESLMFVRSQTVRMLRYYSDLMLTESCVGTFAVCTCLTYFATGFISCWPNLMCWRVLSMYVLDLFRSGFDLMLTEPCAGAFAACKCLTYFATGLISC